MTIGAECVHMYLPPAVTKIKSSEFHKETVKSTGRKKVRTVMPTMWSNCSSVQALGHWTMTTVVTCSFGISLLVLVRSFNGILMYSKRFYEDIDLMKIMHGSSLGCKAYFI